MTRPLVSTEWLADRLGDPEIKVLDATFFLPGMGDAEAAYLASHLPGALRFDIDEVSDHADPLPHMLPAPDAFAAMVGAMGVGDRDHVIAYGQAGPRVWWMFRAMGHDQVSVLDGGLAKWVAEDRPTWAGDTPAAPPKTFTARFRPELVKDFAAVKAALAAGAPVLDARPAGRFAGEAPEPRPGLKGGHMPGAKSLPSTTLFKADGTFLDVAEAAALIEAAGYDGRQPAIASCGSGVTACMIALALARQGRWDVGVYDGSWSEWGARDDVPVVTGT